MDKPAISLTDFIDVVLKSGVPKATKIRQIKYRRPYSVKSDYYKRIRDKIIEIHTTKLTTKELFHLASIVPKSKKFHYNNIAQAYEKWLGTKKPKWLEPPKSLYLGKKIDIRVNPELGLLINNIPYIIKLYFKSDELQKNRAIHIYQMMEETLRDLCIYGENMAVLDVTRAKLFTFSGPDPLVSATIKAELAYIESIWDNL